MHLIDQLDRALKMLFVSNLPCSSRIFAVLVRIAVRLVQRAEFLKMIPDARALIASTVTQMQQLRQMPMNMLDDIRA